MFAFAVSLALSVFAHGPVALAPAVSSPAASAYVAVQVPAAAANAVARVHVDTLTYIECSAIRVC